MRFAFMPLPLIDEREAPPWQEERRGNGPEGRPWITVSYAQSIDGCIAAHPDQQLLLSGPEALRETHRLRSLHDAILVGIGTVLVDDPRLSVRLVKGDNPRPIILDSLLRFPASARMLSEPGPRPLIFTSTAAPIDRERVLTERGVEIVRRQAGEDGLVRLVDVLHALRERGIRSVMVEGGSSIITRFFRRRLVDDVVITIAPCIVRGGLKALGNIEERETLPSLPVRTIRVRQAGKDVILYGKPEWGAA